MKPKMKSTKKKRGIFFPWVEREGREDFASQDFEGSKLLQYLGEKWDSPWSHIL